MKTSLLTLLFVLAVQIFIQPQNPTVQAVINQTNIDSLTYFVKELSGIVPVNIGGSPYTIVSRYKLNASNDKASDYIKQKLESYGLTAYNQVFSATGRNVYAVQPGTVYPNKKYIICAHFDDMPSGTTAPGADDNASGTAAVIEAARIMSQYDSKYTIIYALWDEEEQGLVGSAYYANNTIDSILGVINMDMIAWDNDLDGRGEIHTRNYGNSYALRDTMLNVNTLYSIGILPVSQNNGTTASDQASFWYRGYGALLLIEEYFGGDFNAYYHTVNDKLQYFNQPYYLKMSKLALGTVATLAQLQPVSTFALTVNVADGWNMVSIPGLLPTNQNVTSWWPGRDPNSGVFKFSAGYQQVTVADPGEGYWMKNLGAQTYNTGDEWPAGGISVVSHDPIPAAAGWNLFGGYEQAVSAAGVSTTPPGLISGSIYQYSGGYVPASTITPGYGYFVKLTGAGTINIPSAGPDKTTAGISLKDFGKITITDAGQKSYTLYAAKGEVDLNQFELPPSPPQGMFDVRYSSQRFAESLSNPQSIEMSSVEYPVRLKAEGTNLILSDETGREIARLKSGEEVTVNTAGKLFLSDNVIPSVYSLEQNYPNPFNPGTTIQFSIPEEAQNVKLIIFNSLGEKVAELVNSSMQPGTYNYTWNAENFSSGLYIYQLTSEKFVQTKKMVLLK